MALLRKKMDAHNRERSSWHAAEPHTEDQSMGRLRGVRCSDGLDAGSLIDAAAEMLRQRGLNALDLALDEDGLRVEAPDADAESLLDREPIDGKVLAAVNARLRSASIPEDLPPMRMTIPVTEASFRGGVLLNKVREDIRRGEPRYQGTIVDLLLAHDDDAEEIVIDLPTKWHYEAMTRFIEDNEAFIAPQDFRQMLTDIGRIPGGYASDFRFKRQYAELLCRHARRIHDEIQTGSRPDATWELIGERVVRDLANQIDPSLERKSSALYMDVTFISR